MSYYQEQEFLYAPEERDFFDEDEEREVDYGEEKEEKESDDDFDDNDISHMDIEEKTFGDQEDLIDPNQFVELTAASLPFSMRDLYSGPLTSLQQIKMLYMKKNEKIDFSEMTDIDLFKLLVNLTCYSNKVHELLALKSMQKDIDTMLVYVEKIPDIKYKNPITTFLSYLCMERGGKINKSILQKVYGITDTLMLQKSDIFRYLRMWQKIYNVKIECS
jgi:hypothetical protein